MNKKCPECGLVVKCASCPTVDDICPNCGADLSTISTLPVDPYA